MTRPTSQVLSRSLAPLHEESLAGFLLRLAHRLNSSPWRIADLCGLGNRRASIGYENLRDLPDEVAVRFSQAARLSPQEVNALTMRRFTSSYPLLQRVQTNTAVTGRTALVNWAMTPSSRFCPECLHGDGSPVQVAFGGAWNIRWHLPVVFACTQHHRLLHAVCPSCSSPLNTRGSGGIGLIKHPRLAGLHPLQCRHILVADQIRKRASRADAACGARLDQTPDRGSTLSSEDLNQLLTLQQRLDRSLTAAEQPVGHRQPVDPSFFPDLVMATHLIKLSWPSGAKLLPSAALAALVDVHCAPVTVPAPAGQGISAGSQHIQTRPAPTDSAQCGALLLAADNLLGDRELASLHERVQPLAREAYGRHMNYLSKILSAADISVTLSRAAARRVYGHSNRANPRALPASHRYRVEEIPPALPRALFDTHFVPLTERLPSVTYEMQRYLRRAASLRLVELISGRTWRQCATALNIPESSARQTLNVRGRAFAADGLWPIFEDVVDRIAQELNECDARVDYAKRRQLMAQWRLPGDHHHAMCQDLPKLQKLREQSVLSPIAVLVWSSVTETEYLHSPILKALLGEAEARSLTLRIHRIVRTASPAGSPSRRLRRRIDGYATRLAAACDHDLDLKVSVAEVIREESTDFASRMSR